VKRGYGRYALRRAAQAVVVILLAYVLTFVVISVLPGDPVTATLRNPQNGFTEEEIARIVAYYGLDQPVPVQLWHSLSRFLIGDLGVSLRSNLPVSHLISQVLPSTLVLAGSAIAIGAVLAFTIALGVQYLPRPLGPALRVFPSLFLSVPTFLIGLLLIQVFSFRLGLFKVIDPDSGLATFFAALTLGIFVSAQIAEVLIANLDGEAGQEYAGVARSRGMGRIALLLRHLLKPSSLPVVTVLALMVGEVLGGSIITEAVFGRTGLGSLVESSVSTQDLPVLQAVVTLAAIVFVVVNLGADLLYPLLDPRVTLIAGRRTSTARPESGVTGPGVTERGVAAR
jgi:peptide/nickel transport system permease protein